ncbi:MAG TPA: hypothetical protein VF753_00005, partial [Terriglobales bacterium]
MESSESMLRPVVFPIVILLGYMLLGPQHESANPVFSQPAPHDQRKSEMHDLLSSSQLSPPLRGAVSQVRFSPDGKYIVVQN